MKNYICARVLEIADYLLRSKCTVREVARACCVSKSTAHKDLTQRLPLLDEAKYRQICAILDVNRAERHLRGGIATKNKYKNR